MDWKANIECGKCGTKATVDVPDSIPYCTKCGKQITPDEIKHAADAEAARNEVRAEMLAEIGDLSDFRL